LIFGASQNTGFSKEKEINVCFVNALFLQLVFALLTACNKCIFFVSKIDSQFVSYMPIFRLNIGESFSINKATAIENKVFYNKIQSRL